MEQSTIELPVDIAVIVNVSNLSINNPFKVSVSKLSNFPKTNDPN